MKQFQLHVVSQDKKLLSLAVDSVTVPTAEGEITVLPKHIPLIGKVKTGELVYRTDGQASSVVVSDGFVNVEPSGDVTVLVDNGILDRDASVQRAEDAIKAAHETMQKTEDQRELMMAEASLKQAMMELKVAQKTHKARI